MLYHIYNLQQAALTPVRLMNGATQLFFGNPFSPMAHTRFGRSVVAGTEVLDHVIRHREKPEWKLGRITVGGETVRVKPRTIQATPFCNLVHFERAVRRDNPKVLIVAPMSGHHSTLLRGTVAGLLPEHDVYITDWVDAREIPKDVGPFGLQDYIAHVLDFLRRLGPDLHVIAVCQPAPCVLSAVALLASARDPAQPRSMTLMGGPIDSRKHPTIVSRMAENRSLSWFERHVIATVPYQFDGYGRRVYPGFLQLSAFISMNPGRHLGAHLSMFDHLIVGDGESAGAHRKFYDEYLSVMDTCAEFYLETIEHVFKHHSLPTGKLAWRDNLVEPKAIEKTALLTVEGELDDISAPGQTQAAHDLCANLPSWKKSHHLQKGVGHYGIFNGRRFREQILPEISAFIRAHGG